MKPPQNLAVLMAEKTNEQLLEIFQRPDDWLPEAQEAAAVELRRRGIEFETNSKATSIDLPPATEMDGLFVKADEIICLPQSDPREPTLPQKLSGLAVLSFCFACSSFVTLFIGSAGGILFGHLALWRIRRNSELCGRTLAMWGMAIGYISLAILFLIGVCLVKGMSGLH